MRALWLAILLTLTTTLVGCRAIEGIFKAGFVSGILVAVLLVAGVGFLVARMR